MNHYYSQLIFGLIFYCHFSFGQQITIHGGKLVDVSGNPIEDIHRM